MRNQIKEFDGEPLDLTKIVNWVKSLSSDTSSKEKLIVILGATATGKSKLALELAEIFGTEIISADSMSVYKNFNVGTAKPGELDRVKVKHHLIDILEPNEKFSVAEFVRRATPIITELNRAGKIPIIAGGTGLYIQALVEGYKFSEDGAKSQEKNFLETGELNYNALVIGLTMPREILYKRIDERTEKMFAAGLVDEVQKLLSQGVNPNSQAMSGIGYKEVVEHLQGKISLDEAISKVKQATRNFAKRQLTWYRRMKYIYWFNVD
ncbi:MAG: tRNA dimethylallyltransferase [Selenomonadaceae bacterium]|nr:tRNA dimethylallyltransferase [Selenomonadaceae bacterium]